MAKLANNILAAGVMVMTSEVMAMGVKAGLDPADPARYHPGRLGQEQRRRGQFPAASCPAPSTSATIGLSYKDVRLCVDEAEGMGVPLVAGAAVRQMLAITTAKYGADSDFTNIARVVEEWAKVEIRK